MSWSISLVGTPKKIEEALILHTEKLSGQSKLEFDEALPHLVGLLKQNFGEQYMNRPLYVQLEASGSGSCKKGTVEGSPDEQVSRTCQVSLKTFNYNVLM